jgi:glycosyltransferase involved in cell wall biosynthesis
VSGIEKAGGKVSNFPAKDNVRIMMEAGAVIKYIRKHHIDLVHCHLPWAGFLGRIIHQRIGIPVIYTEHNKQERYHKLTRLLNKKTFNKQSLAIAVSDDVADSIRHHIDVKIPLMVIPNGVNTERFQRDETAGKECRSCYGIPENAVLIGNIAVFRFQKRLKEWLDLFKTVHDQCPDIYGMIVGDGPLKEEVMQHARECGLEHKIIFPGLQMDVIPFLSAMDIFVMTSEFEGLPIALLEAMSMSCAIVSTDAGGIKEVIRTQKDGFLYPVSHWMDMSADIKRLSSNKQEIMAWGSRARQRAVDAFGIQSMVKKTEGLYLSLVNQS